MQPESHRRIIAASIAVAGEPWLASHAGAILAGNDDEDTFVLSALGRSLRLPSLGLSHTYRPGSRFGELWAPSGKVRCLELVARAEGASTLAGGRGAWWLGRACHLIIDAAVPARAHRVWHFAGDPLESWVEANLDALLALPLPRATCHTPAEVMDRLARLAMALPADTTKTLWGATKYRVVRRGKKLSEEEIDAQARELVPATVAHLAAALGSFARRLGATERKGFDRGGPVGSAVEGRWARSRSNGHAGGRPARYAGTSARRASVAAPSGHSRPWWAR